MSIVLPLAVAELLLRWRERRLRHRDLQMLPDSNVDQLMSRAPDDRVNMLVFNGCLVDQALVRSDSVLGQIDVPNMQGYGIRIYGVENYLVSDRFDLSVLGESKVPVELSSFHINALGNRGQEMTREKPPGTVQLAFVGDSVTFGYYVDDEATYPARVGALLPGRLPLDLSSGSGQRRRADDQCRAGFAHLRERAMTWSPDAVVWGLYVNDVVEQEANVLFPVRRVRGERALRAWAVGRLMLRGMAGAPWGLGASIDRSSSINVAVDEGWTKTEMLLADAHSMLEACRWWWWRCRARFSSAGRGRAGRFRSGCAPCARGIRSRS